MQNFDYKTDYKNQLVEIESDLKTQQELIEYIEPSFWRRVLAGSLFYVIELLLIVIIMALVVLMIWIDLNALLQFSGEINQDVSVNIEFKSETINTINLILKGVVAIAEIPFVVLFFLFRNLRKNLFKLAEVSEHLIKEIEKDKTRRDTIMQVIIKA